MTPQPRVGHTARRRLPAALLACVLLLTVAGRAERTHHQKQGPRAPVAIGALSSDNAGTVIRLDQHATAAGTATGETVLASAPASAAAATDAVSRPAAAASARGPPGSTGA